MTDIATPKNPLVPVAAVKLTVGTAGATASETVAAFELPTELVAVTK